MRYELYTIQVFEYIRAFIYTNTSTVKYIRIIKIMHTFERRHDGRFVYECVCVFFSRSIILNLTLIYMEMLIDAIASL